MDGMNWRRLIAVGGMASLGFVAACSDDDDPDGGTTTDTGTNPDGGTADTGPGDTGPGDTGPGDTGPTDAGFIKVNFTIDDSANRVYDQAGGLAWKGSFTFDNTTRVMVKTGWVPPYATLWDDGPVASGGHEPEGATANDNRWGIEALVAKPAADEMFQYGAISGSANGSDGNWIWSLEHAMDGTFTVPANSDNPITVVGLTLPAFGTIDFRLTIDTSTLAPEFSATNPDDGVGVKGSAWGWGPTLLADDGQNGDETAADGIYTFQLSEFVGVGNTFRYFGRTKSGDEPEFIFVFGPDPAIGLEYKAGGSAAIQGIKAEVRAEGAPAWTEVPVMLRPGPQNTNSYITIP